MSFLSWLTGVDIDAERQRGEALDRQLAELNAREYSPGGRIYERTVAEQGEAVAVRNWETVQRQAEASADYTGPSLLSFWWDTLTAPWAAVTNPSDYARDLEAGATIAGERAGEAVAGVANTFTGTLWNGATSFAKKIPVWLWLVTALAVFLYFGGGRLLPKLFKR
ncbi:MAG TPA: hypothetical protein PKA41_15565 [Verrucomicrobiota bacterium]|nr:hypothetical protein [Verrucomicrobiota bacterium]